MKTLLLVLLLSTTTVQAATSDYVKTSWCLPSFPYGMYVTAKDGNRYAVSQTGSGLSELGIVELTSNARSGERLNVLVQYVGTKTMHGKDGFDHDVDVWKQCYQVKSAR